MPPLSREDFELECDLARWEAAFTQEYERDYDDARRDALDEAEAMELAAGAKIRPFTEVV